MPPSPSTLDHFHCALVTGGGGGLGKALAAYFIKRGKKVIIAGRTESKLRAAAEEIGATAYYVLDTGDIASIAGFVQRLTQEHPDVDCLVNNAGVQRPLDANGMSADEFLEKADQEVDINVRGPMHLALRMLPHFKTHEGGAVVMNVSSVLGYIPTSVVNPVYNGTKAFVHFHTMNLRTQLKRDEDGRRIRVVEIVPPTVATDLHRERSDPDDNKKEKNEAALSVDGLVGDVVRGLDEGRGTIGAGMGQGIVDRWNGEFGPDYEKAAGGGR